MAENGEKRDPSTHRTPTQNKRRRAYQKKYNEEHKDAQKKRMAARYQAKKKHGEAALKGKDIDHKKPLRNGGTNAKGNLRIKSEKANRGWNRSKGSNPNGRG